MAKKFIIFEDEDPFDEAFGIVAIIFLLIVIGGLIYGVVMVLAAALQIALLVLVPVAFWIGILTGVFMATTGVFAYQKKKNL